jgi:hypothetical protein
MLVERGKMHAEHPRGKRHEKYCIGLHYIVVIDCWVKFTSAFVLRLVSKVCLPPVLMSLNVLNCLSNSVSLHLT